MPITPQAKRGVEQQALPGARQSIATDPDMFGAAQGRALSQASKALAGASDDAMSAALKLQQDQDATSLMELENSVRDFENAELWDEQNGVFTRKGKNSFGSDEEVAKKYGERFDGYLDQEDVKLSQRARLKAADFISRRRDGISSDVKRHINGQRDIHDKGVFEASIAGAVEDAAKYYNDPARLKQARASIRVKSISEGNRFGRSTEETKQAIEKHVSSMHAAVIDRMVQNGEGSAAKEYLAKNKKEIDGADIAKLEGAARKASVDEAGAKLEQVYYDPTAKVADIIAKIEATPASREEKDEAVKRVRTRRIVDDSDRAREEKDQRKGAWAHLEAGGSFDTIPNKENIEGTTLASMEKFALAKRSGAPSVSIKETYAEIWNQFRDAPEEFARRDLTKDWGNLSEGDRKRFENLQSGMLKSDAKEAAKRVTITKAMSLGKPAMRAAGIDPNAKKGKPAEKLAQFQSALIEQLEIEQDAKGGKLDDKDIERVVDGLLLQGEKTGSGWIEDDDARQFQGDGEPWDMGDFAKDNAPTFKKWGASLGVSGDDVAVYAEALRQKGYAVSYRLIQRLIANQGAQ